MKSKDIIEEESVGMIKFGSATIADMFILIRFIVGAYKGQNYKISYIYLVLMVAFIPLLIFMSRIFGGH